MDLQSLHCESFASGKLVALTDFQILPYLNQLGDDWQIKEQCLVRTFTFKGFLKTMSFFNAVAWLANEQMHHPDFKISFNQCEIHLTTHDVNGLSLNDFIMAARINSLLKG